MINFEIMEDEKAQDQLISILTLVKLSTNWQYDVGYRQLNNKFNYQHDYKEWIMLENKIIRIHISPTQYIHNEIDIYIIWRVYNHKEKLSITIYKFNHEHIRINKQPYLDMIQELNTFLIGVIS